LACAKAAMVVLPAKRGRACGGAAEINPPGLFESWGDP